MTPSDAAFPQTEDASPSELSRVRRHRWMLARQTVLFGWIALAMVAVFVVSLPFALGIVALPFGNSFTLSPEAQAKIPPCAPKGKPVALSTVKVSVMNGSSRNGLAKETADRLKTFGVVIVSVGNAADSYSGAARITTNKEGIAQAYSLARALPNADVRLNLEKKSELTVLLGEQFQGALSKEILGHDDLGKFPESPPKCSHFD